MGPLKVAHLNGLSVSRQPMYEEVKDEPERASNDERVGLFDFVSDLLPDRWTCKAETNVNV